MIDIRIALTLLLVGAVMPAAAHAQRSPAQGATPGPWTDLLAGGAQRSWRGYKQPTLPDGWTYEAATGILARTGSGGDIVTRAEYGDFELELDWRIAAGGNSGVFYRATEAHGAIYESAPEMQVLDDALHRDGQSPLTSAGANFGLYPAVPRAVRPAGEWNRALLFVQGNSVEHWLNGVRVVHYTLGSDDWAAKVAASKFAQWPAYGRAPKGRIGLQDHGDLVEFRNVRIRELAP